MNEEEGGLSPETKNSPRLCIQWPISSILFVLFVFLLIGCVYSVLYVLFCYVAAWPLAFVEISTLAASPDDLACPMLWSDPMSQWIWWLA
jgi:hypothetical protein